MNQGNDKKLRLFLFSLQNYAIFFLMVSFVVSCCMLLFLNNMAETMDIVFAEDDIQKAAKLTMGNVFLLSFLFTLFDWGRRKVMVERPVKRIIAGAEKIMQGDFTTRIEPFRDTEGMESFNTIIDCFNRVSEELSGIETLRTDFIANVSHEIKTPLAVMQNYATMLARPGLSDEQRIEYAKTINDASRRLSSLITNILKLNKLENQQIHLMNEHFNLGEQLCECLIEFEDVWEKKSIEIATDIEEDVFITSDAELLSLIWHNLFSNAIKFTPEQGTVMLTMKTAGDSVVVTVADTGCGISKEVGEHIFEKFYQGDTSHAAQGNGLGLALVKRVVDIVGADIYVESELGRGSMFIVRLKRGDSNEDAESME